VTEAGKRRIARGFIEEYLADRATAFLDDAARGPAPFFLHLCTQLPHMDAEFTWKPRPETLRLYDGAPLRVPANWRDDLRGKPPYLAEGRHRQQAQSYGYTAEAAVRKHLALYYAAITDLDRALGRVFAALDRLGVAENTYVFLMGDNGWLIGEHGFTSKVLPYEESIRIPLAIAGPGLPGGTRGDLVLNADVAPTLLELAGIDPPPSMHGRSMRGLLEGRQAQWRSSIYYEALEPTLGSWPLVAIRDRRWKYVRTFDVKDRARLVFEELYDLQDDPGELCNLASSAEHAGTRRRLKAGLEKQRTAIAT
jgi:arylsulfatase A-like enzyme